VLFRFLIVLTGVLLCVGQSACAQTWPEKPIRVIVPFAAGGIIDIVPRMIFERVSAQLHQPIVLINRPGAGSTIGAATVAVAPPDGYTLLVNSSAQTIAPLLYSHLPYDAVRAFSAISPLVAMADVLVISPSKGIRNLRDFVKFARAKHGALTFASLGVGSAIYMSAERFRLSARFKATNVSFRGPAAALIEVLEGRVDYCFCAVGATLPYIKAGKLLALAIGGAKRSPLLPDVPTTLEEGFSESDYTPWFGVFAPAKTPAAVIEKLNNAIQNALQMSDVRQKLTKLGVEPLNMSPSVFDAYVRDDISRNASMVAKLGLKKR
jgi:tripartite-type tricarboxylate transporter receptor subunit TctC